MDKTKEKSIMNQFSKQTDWNYVRTIINKHLQEAAKELNIKIQELGGLSYTLNSFSTKLHGFAVVTTPAGTKSPEQINWEKQKFYLASVGLTTEHFNKIFINGIGEKFQAVEIKPRRSKFPLVGKRLADGKLFKFPLHAVKFLGEPIVIPPVEIHGFPTPTPLQQLIGK